MSGQTRFLAPLGKFGGLPGNYIKDLLPFRSKDKSRAEDGNFTLADRIKP